MPVYHRCLWGRGAGSTIMALCMDSVASSRAIYIQTLNINCERQIAQFLGTTNWQGNHALCNMAYNW